MNLNDYREAGYTIFGLHSVENNICTCENPDCTALYKHPRTSAWQHTPFYSDEQFDFMVELGHMKTGFGVLVKDMLIVDIDVRNGGAESYEKLCADIGYRLEEKCGFIVETGSKDGSKHLYFKLSAPTPLMQNHPAYKGLDFKSSGYVVGCGSKHRSGFYYECEDGAPDELTEVPIDLLKLLEKRSYFRATTDDGVIDIKLEDLKEVVMSIQNTEGAHDRWLNVGMGIHHTTQGAKEGCDLWAEWSDQFPKYDYNELAHRYDTLGKTATPITYGTLLHYALADGYTQPVTFEHTEQAAPFELLDVSHIDIRKPHGFVGTLCQWINKQCLYPRENLAAAAALYVMSCITGMRAKDEDFGANGNLMTFGVAASGTGKDSVYKSVIELLRVAGLSAAVHGKFKSEQEAIRNLLRHQASFYTIDEMGIELGKVANAQKRGGAAYMEGLIGFIMNAYSKADGILPVSGDMKEDIKENIKAELQKLNKRVDSGHINEDDPSFAPLYKQLQEADEGIVNPYVALLGTTTPSTFYDLIDEDMASNGFIARTVIFKEKEDNPRWKNNFKKEPLDLHVSVAIKQLYNNTGGRVCASETPIKVTTAEDAKQALYEIREYFYNVAEAQKETKNLIPIPRRGFEMVLKISLILAIPTGVRTLQDVLYAFKVAKEDVEFKMELANANRETKQKDEAGEVLLSAIKTKLDKDVPVSIGQIRNKIRKFSRENIDEGIEHLVKQGVIEKIEVPHKTNGAPIMKLRLKK